MTITIDTITKRWTDPKARPLFRGKLIDGDGCCCAQGDVLRCAGWSDTAIRSLIQANADKEVAKILGISRGQAVLLRIVNDSKDGCPQDVFLNPEKVLGPNARYVLAFFRHIDTLGADGWEKVAAAWDAVGAAAWDAARTAAWDAAWDAAGTAARTAAGTAARTAAGTAARTAARDAAWAAAGELVGISHLAPPFFLKFFFEDVEAWKKSVDAGEKP